MEIHSLSRQCVVDAKRIQRFYHFHIGIHIKTAMIMEHFQAGIVGDESPFLCLIRLSAVRILRHVEVAFFIPLDDFIIWAVCFSGSDVLLHLFSQRISAKPAVMYLLRNHCILSPLIYILISIFILQIVPCSLLGIPSTDRDASSSPYSPYLPQLRSHPRSP